jgi:hypothetical protein
MGANFFYNGNKSALPNSGKSQPIWRRWKAVMLRRNENKMHLPCIEPKKVLTEGPMAGIYAFPAG